MICDDMIWYDQITSYQVIPYVSLLYARYAEPRETQKKSWAPTLGFHLLGCVVRRVCISISTYKSDPGARALAELGWPGGGSGGPGMVSGQINNGPDSKILLQTQKIYEKSPKWRRNHEISIWPVQSGWNRVAEFDFHSPDMKNMHKSRNFEEISIFMSSIYVYI